MTSAVAKRQNTKVVEVQEHQLPAFLEADAGKNMGMEKLGQSDVAIPRIKLIQGLSPEKETFNDLREGDFFHLAAEKIIPQPFIITPIFIDKRYILWRPRGQGGGILARANDAVHWQPANQKFTVQLDKKMGGHVVCWETKRTVEESGLDEWGTSNPNDSTSQPAASLMYNLLVAFPLNPEFSPAILTFSRTGIKYAQNLNMKLMSLNRPIFQSLVEISSNKDSGPEGDFYSISTKLSGLIGVTKFNGKVAGNEAMYNAYKAMYEGLSKYGLDIKDEAGLQDEVQSSNSEAAGTPSY
jgi:hypothetical protein